MGNVVAAQKKAPVLIQGKGPATRTRLVESARYLFWERGFAGTSMSDLLAHAKVNSGSFYHFFDSKEALLREVLETYLEALRPMVVDPAFATTEEPVERIFAILAGYRERILMTDSKYGCPLGRLALEIDPENRPAHKLIAENFSGWVSAVRECVDEVIDKMPKGTDAEALSTYVLAVMEGGVMLSRSYSSVEPFDRTVRQLREHFQLLMPKSSKEKPQTQKRSFRVGQTRSSSGAKILQRLPLRKRSDA